MLYVQSTNAGDGTMTLNVTFDVETEVNIDQVNAQNRVAQAQPNLPADVNQFGLSYRSTVGLPLLVFAIYSPKGTYDSLFLGNYAVINVNDALYRVNGVGQVLNFGLSEYAIRIWVKPDKLAKLGLTVPNLVRASSSKVPSTRRAAWGVSPRPRDSSSPTPCGPRVGS
jgi:HAE1 family hydrophobic/amphiphilic exporter-1